MDKDMKMRKMMWIKLILGLWVLVSPWVIPSNLMISNVIVGILLILMTCMGIMKHKSMTMPPKM